MEKMILARRNGALTVGALKQLRGQEALVRFQGKPDDAWIRRESIIWVGDEKPAESGKVSRWLEKQFQLLFDEADTLDVEVLWTGLSHEEDAREFPLAELRQRTSDISEGGLVMALELNRELFKRTAGGYLAFSNRERAARVERRQAPWSSDWRAQRITLIKGLMDSHGGRDDAASDETLIKILWNLAIATEKEGYPGRERKLLEEAFGYPLLRPEHAARDLLEKMGVWRPEEPVEAHREGIPLVHHRETEEEAGELLRHCHEERSRQQERRVIETGHWIAIDEASTRDVDDALWAEETADGGIRVYVAIADPAEWVTEGSHVWNAARQRGASMYLPNDTYPMFPHVLANEFCSLIVGEKRLAVLFSWTITPFGQIEGFAIEEVLLTLTRRVTYEAVDQHLAAGNSPELELLADAANRMRQRRGNRGGLLLRQTEWKCFLDEEGNPRIKVLSPFSRAREIVSELMIATGALTGEFLDERGVPAIYRCQNPPDEEPDFPVEDLSDAADLYDLFRTMKRAETALDAHPHYMLGAQAYSQVSSPLRRFCDLVMHHQIKSWLRSGEPAWSREKLSSLIEGVEDSVRVRLKVERECHRYQALRLLSANSNPSIRGQVVRRMGRRFLVALLDFGIREACHLNNGVEVGDKINLKIDVADPEMNQLKMSQG